MYYINRQKYNAMVKSLYLSRKKISRSNDSRNKLQHLSITISSTLLDCHNQYISGKKSRIKAYASAKSREDVALERFHLSIFVCALAALRIEAQLNVYLLNSYQTNI